MLRPLTTSLGAQNERLNAAETATPWTLPHLHSWPSKLYIEGAAAEMEITVEVTVEEVVKLDGIATDR